MVVMTANKVQATVQENVRFESEVTGKPDPTVEWLVNYR